MKTPGAKRVAYWHSEYDGRDYRAELMPDKSIVVSIWVSRATVGLVARRGFYRTVQYDALDRERLMKEARTALNQLQTWEKNRCARPVQRP